MSAGLSPMQLATNSAGPGVHAATFSIFSRLIVLKALNQSRGRTQRPV